MIYVNEDVTCEYVTPYVNKSCHMSKGRRDDSDMSHVPIIPKVSPVTHLTRSHTLSLCVISHKVCVCFSMSLDAYLCVCLFLCLSVLLSLWLALSLSRSLSLSLALALLSLAISLWVRVFLCHSVCVYESRQIMSLSFYSSASTTFSAFFCLNVFGLVVFTLFSNTHTYEHTHTNTHILTNIHCSLCPFRTNVLFGTCTRHLSFSLFCLTFCPALALNWLAHTRVLSYSHSPKTYSRSAICVCICMCAHVCSSRGLCVCVCVCVCLAHIGVLLFSQSREACSRSAISVNIGDQPSVVSAAPDSCQGLLQCVAVCCSV